MVTTPQLPDEVIEHYEAADEERRLRDGLGQLEFVRVQQIVRRHLPPGPLEIVDVGGATGVHARWLVDDGHRVHLVDPVESQVAAALESPAARSGRLTAQTGDARELARADGSADATLLFGPLYHLTDRRDRLRALGEARRVTRPGGLVFVAAISRFASLFDGLARGLLFDTQFAQIVRRDLADGQHRNATRHPSFFTTAYFHHPDEIAAELADAGLAVREVVGVEGIAAWLGHLADRWSDQQARELIVWSAAAVEAEPTLRGLSPHLVGVAEVPTAST